ncbi:MAG: hypothetical protein HKP19_09680 [Xanthomonadales bacterium]|nr:hypothetical protein [Xanthomonadales bacterium]
MRAMIAIRRMAPRFLLWAIILLAAPACAVNPYRNDTTIQNAVETRAILQQQGAIEVRAAVPSEKESSELFGVPLYQRGMQPVWLEVSNQSDLHARFAPYSVDKAYFPPHEVAYTFRKRFSKQGATELERFLHSMSMPRVIEPGTTVSGYVFTQAEPGTKAFNVDVHFIRGESINEHFTFFVQVPGFRPDHAEVDFDSLYAPDEILDLTVPEFRKRVMALPCCTVNRNGTDQGRPVNLFLVGEGLDVLKALLRAKWVENSLNTDVNYLNQMDYFFTRPPDAVFRKIRYEGSSRNELTLWLAPYRIEGKPVWLGHVKHAISRLYGVGEYFFGARLDPDADEGRDFLLQDLWYSQALESFAFTRSGDAVSSDEPRNDLSGEPWFSDGVSTVLWLAPEPISLMKTQNRGWEEEPGRTGGEKP